MELDQQKKINDKAQLNYKTITEENRMLKVKIKDVIQKTKQFKK